MIAQTITGQIKGTLRVPKIVVGGFNARAASFVSKAFFNLHGVRSVANYDVFQALFVARTDALAKPPARAKNCCKVTVATPDSKD